MSASRALTGLAAVALAGAALAARVASGAPISTTAPTKVVVGPPAGPCPLAGCDRARTHRSPTALPSRPRVLWRRGVGASIETPAITSVPGPLVVVATTSPELVALRVDGAEAFRVPLDAVAATEAVAATDGTLVLATMSGEAIGVFPSGRARFRVPLGTASRGARIAPLPLEGGDVAFAIGDELVTIDPAGRATRHVRLAGRATGALLETPDGIVVTTEGGAVLLVGEGAQPRRVGSFGGDPGPGAALVAPSTLVAVVDHRRVAALDLATGARRTLVSAQALSLDGPPAIFADGSAAIMTFAGAVVAFDRDGNETRRTSVGAASKPFAPDAGGAEAVRAAMAPGPPLLVDRDGRVAWGRAGGSVGVLSSDVATNEVGEPPCASPFAFVPAGSSVIVVACRDGTLAALGE